METYSCSECHKLWDSKVLSGGINAADSCKVEIVSDDEAEPQRLFQNKREESDDGGDPMWGGKEEEVEAKVTENFPINGFGKQGGNSIRLVIFRAPFQSDFRAIFSPM